MLADDVPPRRLGRYELLRVLGRGGQGQVWEALLVGPAGLRKRVALKVLDRGDGLQREARIGGLLRHPNLVDVYEVGEDGGRWFCAMELCGGGALSERLPLSLRAVVDVGLQVCAALSYAHEELGLVHLDLKPENLLISGSSVKVADLGLARARGFERRKRGPGGTQGFMAPEQAHAGPVDARTDVYGLGVTLLVLATGTPPPRPSDTLTFDSDAELDAAPVPAFAIGDRLGALGPIVERCLQADPDDRFPSMAALAEALRGVDAPGPRIRKLLGAGDDGADPPPRGPGLPAPDPEPGDVHDAFVGRRVETGAIAAALAEPGLLTVRGPAGIGKTRLACEAASRWTLETGRPAWFVPLADARSASDVVRSVAGVLGVDLQAQSDPALVTMLGHALASRGDALLVLDNVEQLEGAADVVQPWLVAAPRLRLLATGRQALEADGERILDLDVLDPTDAVELLRVRALDRGVSLGEDPAVASLAERLEGVPLAIELAAGRLGVLSPSEVAERLGLSLLRSGRADLPDRQATLRGALDWSWALLSEPERACLAALSVFRGGFTLEAVEAVVELAPGAAWVLDVVQALAEKSLLRGGAGRRFDLLVPVREYASLRLAERGGVAEAELRHAAWFASRGGAHPADEIANLVVACQRAVARGDGAMAAATLESAGRHFHYRGPFRAWRALAEDVLAIPGLDAASRRGALLAAGDAARDSGEPARAAACFEAVLATDPPDAQRIAATIGLAAVLDNQGGGAKAVPLLEEALRIATRTGDRAREGEASRILGLSLFSLGRIDEARAALERALALMREAGSRADEAQVLASFGTLERGRAGPEKAIGHFEQALAIQRALGNRRSMGVVTWQLAAAKRLAGRLDEAEQLFRESLEMHREVGNRRFEGLALASLGNVLADRKQFEEAMPWYEAALAVHRETRNRRDEGIVLSNLAAIALLLERVSECRSWCERALALFRETGFREQEAVILDYQVQLLALEGRHEEALAATDEVLALHREVQNWRMEGLALVAKAETLERVGRLRDAVAAAREGMALLETVGDRSVASRAEALLARLERPGS